MKLFKGISIFKNRLTKFKDDEPLTKLALVVIIILDIFILSVVFGGLSSHTEQLTSPYEYFPHNCRDIFIDKQWTQADKIDRLQNLVLRDYNHYSYRYDSPFEKSKIDKMHPNCKRFYAAVKEIADNKEIKKLFIERQGLIDKKNKWLQQYSKNKDVYETQLLENIAGKNKDALATISQTINAQSQEIERLTKEISQVNKQLGEEQLINKLWQLIRPGDQSLRNAMIKDLNRYEKIYLFKEFLWQLLFMLPLFIVFYIWHTKSIKKNNTLHILISSHLLIIASIPIVIKIIRVVIDLIPYHFFKELFKILQLMHIIALWHYIVILLSIFAAMFFVYLIQKKLFNTKHLRQKRLMKGECYSCGKKLPPNGDVCPFCSASQLEKCGKCKTNTYVAGEYCINCGEKKESVTQ